MVKNLKLLGRETVYGEGIVAKSAIKAGLKPVLEMNLRYPDYKRPGHVETAEDTTFLTVMERLITRKNKETGEVWNPSEGVTRQEALWMATNWASRVYGDEKILGTLESGKLADLVILGGDYMTVPEDQISKIPLVKVIVGGKIMYEKQ